MPSISAALRQQLLLLTLLPLLHAFRGAFALILEAPSACGGRQVVTHATALFGPRIGSSCIRNVPLFAPRAQQDGVYVRSEQIRRPAQPNGRPYRLPPPSPLIKLLRLMLASPFRKTAIRTSIQPEPLPAPVADPEPLLQSAPVPGVDRVELDELYDLAQHVGLRTERIKSDDGEGSHPIVEALPPISPADSRTFSLFNACRQLSVPADLRHAKGHIVVVARGMCEFSHKVLLMQDAGAAGVIVVNYRSDNTLANMKLNDTKDEPMFKIPALMINFKDWMPLAACRYNINATLSTEGEASFDMDYGRDALNWIMMRGMALWILCQCGVNVVRYKRRVSEFRARADAIAALPVEVYERPTRDTDEEPPVAAPVISGPAPSSPVLDHDPERAAFMSDTYRETKPDADMDLDPVPSSSSNGTEEEEEEPVCAVCLEDFVTGQQVRMLACSHLYHRTCIDPWLQLSSNCCPLCKREVPNLPPPPSQLHYGSMVV